MAERKAKCSPAANNMYITSYTPAPETGTKQ